MKPTIEWRQDDRSRDVAHAKLGACKAHVSRWPLARGSSGQWLAAVFVPGERESRRWWRKTAPEAMALAERELRRACRLTPDARRR